MRPGQRDGSVKVPMKRTSLHLAANGGYELNLLIFCIAVNVSYIGLLILAYLWVYAQRACHMLGETVRLFYLNLVGLMIMASTLVMPTLALPEPVTLSYFARAELVMIASEDAHFECTNDGLPAKIEIDEDTFGSTSANFPPTLLNRPTSPQVNVRRGVELTLESADREMSGFTDDWYMAVVGEIDFCVGLATLQVMQGDLEAFAQLGQYNATILSSDDVLQDLHIEYVTNAAQQSLAHFFNPKRDDFPPQMSAQFVGQLPEDDLDDGQILGRLNFDATQLAVRFTDPNSFEDVTHLTRLNIGLVLEGSASRSLNATINENVADEG